MSGTERQYADKDELERTAEYYNNCLKGLLVDLRRVLDRIDREPENEVGLTYRECLDITRVSERLQEMLAIRDAMGTHSHTGRDLFRWIAHPNKNPKPAWLEDTVTATV